MIRFTLAVLVLCVFATLAAAQADEPIPMLFTSNTPHMDGVIEPAEWGSPGWEQISSVSSPAPVTVSGSFTGAADLTMHTWTLFTTDQIYLAIRVDDDTVTAGDTLQVEVGLATLTIQDGVATTGPAGSWEVVKHPGNPWSLELRIAAAIATPTTLPGSVLSYNLQFVDDDGGADGEMWRNAIGAGFMEAIVPQADLIGVAEFLVALDPQFDDIGNLEKQASRIRKAADDKYWADPYTYASKSASSSSLDRIRSAIKKLEKYAARAEPGLSEQLDRPLALLVRAARVASYRFVAMARQGPGPYPTSADERLGQAEVAFAAGDRRDAVKYYRKAAKKAAKLIF